MCLVFLVGIGFLWFFGFQKREIYKLNLQFFSVKGKVNFKIIICIWWSFTQWFTHPYDWLKHTSMYEAKAMCFELVNMKLSRPRQPPAFQEKNRLYYHSTIRLLRRIS